MIDFFNIKKSNLNKKSIFFFNKNIWCKQIRNEVEVKIEKINKIDDSIQKVKNRKKIMIKIHLFIKNSFHNHDDCLTNQTI